jgi:large subunit ribosomal protein L34e
MLPAKTKSRSFRRKQVRVTSGTVQTYHRRTPKQATCSVTGQKLHGVPRKTVTELKNMSKTEKRPQRPFGGVLSSKASRLVHKTKARQLEL